jgi:riboflavin biosynthesis pyrimidine reductase
VDFRQLHPEPATVEIADYVRGLDLGDRASARRPFTIANFVGSVDGRVAFRGRSRALGDDGDKALFRALRHEVDAVLVGTGTLRAERYGRLIAAAEARQRRRQRGLAPEPLACVVTRSGSVPLDIPLFAEPEARIVIFSQAEIDVRGVAAQTEVVRLRADAAPFTAALTHMRIHHNVRALLCEGGPGVFSALVAERAVDQLFLTLSAKLVGGADENPTIIRGLELPEPTLLSLESVLERNGYLFLRYAFSG